MNLRKLYIKSGLLLIQMLLSMNFIFSQEYILTLNDEFKKEKKIKKYKSYKNLILGIEDTLFLIKKQGYFQAKVDQFIKERFNFPPDQRAFAIQIFNHAKDDRNSFEAYAHQLASLLASNPSSLVMFYELLFELSMADGHLDKAEESLLVSAIEIFNIDPNLFETNKNKFGANLNDAYSILGVDESMPFNEIKKTYQRKRKEFHPDTLISKGLPDELLDKAKEKFIEIQAAFEEIEKKNKLN